jgi:hypothetical protein
MEHMALESNTESKDVLSTKVPSRLSSADLDDLRFFRYVDDRSNGCFTTRTQIYQHTETCVQLADSDRDTRHHVKRLRHLFIIINVAESLDYDRGCAARIVSSASGITDWHRACSHTGFTYENECLFVVSAIPEAV